MPPPQPWRATAIVAHVAGELPEPSALEPMAEIIRKLTPSRLNLMRPSWIEWPRFNEPVDSIYASPWTRSMSSWNFSTAFSFRKLILKFWKTPGPLYLCRKAPRFYFNYVLVPRILQNNLKLFQNYIFTPIISHLGPCVTFYNYK
jgi:hypothetical protein